MSNDQQVQLFHKVGASLDKVIVKNGYTKGVLDEDKLEITLKSLMFFTMKMVYDQQIPEATMVAYVRGVYNDLDRIAQGRDDRAETIADIAKQ